MNNEKVKVTKKEFAEVLFYWLSKQFNRKAIKQTAKLFDLRDKKHKFFSKTEVLFGLNLKNKIDFTILGEELFAFNMWAIVYGCGAMFEDRDSLYECLDIFHRLVYQRLIEGLGENFEQWASSITAKYRDYNKAMETEHEPLLELAAVISQNLFGKVNLDAITQFQIGVYISSTMKALEGLIKKYDIE
jgi:hypothetical protein